MNIYSYIMRFSPILLLLSSCSSSEEQPKKHQGESTVQAETDVDIAPIRKKTTNGMYAGESQKRTPQPIKNDRADAAPKSNKNQTEKAYQEKQYQENVIVKKDNKPTKYNKGEKIPLSIIEELELLFVLKGERYKKRRDNILLRGNALKRQLIDIGEIENWQVETMKVILLGWLNHQELYEKVLLSFDGIDWEKADKRPGGVILVTDSYTKKAEKYGVKIVPFCWEALMKFDDDWPEWKIWSIVNMATTVRHEGTIRVLLHFIENDDEDEWSRYVADQLRYYQKKETLLEEFDLELKRLDNIRERVSSVRTYLEKHYPND